MTSFGTIAYVLVGLFYGLLSALLLTSWCGRLVGGFLIGACVVSTAWAFVLAFQTSGRFVSVPLLFFAEMLRGGAWLTFLAALANRVGISRALSYIATAVWMLAILAGTGMLISGHAPDTIVNLGEAMIPGGLAISFTGLLLLEQLYRNSPPQSRHGFKALAIGVGGIFAYDLFLYAQGFLFGALDSASWVARGAVNILFVPFLAVAARRNPSWDLDIFVSRQVIFYSTTLVSVGLYLFLMSLGAYALSYYGGSWGTLAQLIFFAGALIVLMMLLFSGTLRARLKVFVSKHFFRNKYDYREEWLRLVATLAEFESGPSRQIAISAIAQIVDSPSGFLWICDEDSGMYRFDATYGQAREFPDIAPTEPLVRFMEREGWLIDLDEYYATPEIYRELVIPGWLSDEEAAWLIVPLFVNQNLLGFILLFRAPVRFKLNYEDRDLLKTVGNHVAVHIAQQKSDSLLAEARQFEAYNRLTAFLMHDLNNLIAQQSLIVSNAERHKRNPEFIDDAMQTVTNSVKRMRRIMDQLRRGQETAFSKAVEVKFLVSAAIDRCSGSRPTPACEFNGVSGSVLADPDQFTMILVHLIKNAQDATPHDGQVDVSLHESPGFVHVVVRDTGCGMSPEFIRERLFRPFDSTKGSQGMGIGAYQVREYARKMGGDVSVRSEVGKGTEIRLSIPTAPVTAQEASA